MPFDRDVTIDFNADISGYSQSMGQMIQQTSQYSAAADGMIGKIGKLNNVVLAGVKSMAAFTGTNKVATAQAAAYQQQLSKIETSAKVNNKSFKELEKTTKSLAKDFPIGMKQAVQQVEALQEAGVTSNKEIKSLATTFTKLGAATGTFGPELGQNMLQLNRTFQNGTGSMEKYADSLTQVTHEFGANAGAVTSFAKSIAPVAATVGMNETSVIGLSTAFSRLGEDGYAAANTFNKVMLDMSKSIREGTPEAKIYAEVMGTTSEQLKETWESNPAEGFIDFVEAIKSQGTGGIRSLEMLGLEGVRTQKTIMALAGSGNMREIVSKAQSSYGGGQTATAAETAMGGVNDQMTMLNETMAQTTATAGKPFLGFLEKVLQVANSLAGAISKLVESDAIQGLAKIVGLVGAAWGASKLFTGGALLGSLGLTGAKAVSRSAALADFRAGRAGGLTGEDDSRARQAGAYSRAYIGGPPGAEGRPGLLRRGVGGIRNLANVAGNLGAAYVRSSASQILGSIDEERLKTPEGQRLQRSVEAIKEPPGGGGFFKNRKIMGERFAEVGKNFGAMATQAGGMTDLMRAQAQNMRAAGKFWGRAAGAGARGLGSLGSMATMGLATGPAAVAAGGAAIVAGVGYKYIKGKKDEEEARERGGKDAYRMFNDFAEKAGIATKGLVSFSQVLSESTAKIAAESKTRGEAMEITEKEMIQAKSPGYERAYTTRGKGWVDELLPGHPSAQKEAARLRGMLGSNASPEALNRIQMDLINQFGKEFADKVTDALKEIYEGGEGGRPMTSKEVQAMLHEQAEESQFLGIFGTKESAEFTEMEEAERARAVSVERSVKGVDVEQAEGYRGAEAGLEALQAAAAAKPPEPTGAMYAATSTGVGAQDAASVKNAQDTQAALDLSISELNLTTEEEKRYREASAAATQPQQGVYGMPAQPAAPVDVGQLLENAGMPEKAEVWRETTAAGGKAEGGYQGLTQAEMDAMAVSPMEDAATKAVQRTNDLGGVAGTLATDMAGSAKAYRDWTKELGNGEKTFEDWVNAGSEGATDLQKAYAEVKNMPGDAAKQARLSSEIVKNAVKTATEGGTGAAGAGQIITTAMTTSTGEELPALIDARRKAEQQAQLEGGQSTLAATQGTIEKGRIAEEGLLRTDITAETRAQYEQDADAGKQAQLGRMQQMQQFMTQMTRQQEDFNKNRGRMEQSFQLQQQYAAEDYGKQRKYMIQDYHTSVLNAEADFNKQRMRAQRDFDKQVKRQAEQTAKNMFDPYQRIAPQMVTDIGVLQQSLLEQNQAVQEQLGNVDMLSKMGLSKDAIDQLKLMDPSQNAQVQRLLSDAMSDPTAINKINDLIKTRLKLGTELSTSEYNKDFQNMKDDFGQSMDDMSEDFETNMERGEKAFKRGLRRNGEAFATAQSRAAAAHALALSQMDEDNQQAITRSQEDLVGMAEGFADSYVDVQTKFLEDMANLPTNLSAATKGAITQILQDEIDAVEAANTRAATGGAAAASAEASYYAMGSGGEGGEDMQGVDGPTAGKGSYSGNWRNYRRGGFHGGADIAAPHGTPTYSVIDGSVKYTKRMTTSYGIHALISDGRHDFLYGHMSALHVNAGDKVHPGTQIGKVGSTGNSTGNHLHFEARPAGAGHTSAINPGPWLATGGIVTKHIQPHVGEGGPEAVIPLNDKGMQYLADAINKSAMGRYWNPLDAQGSRSASHSSPVTNNVYTYDQRTQFTGSVEVKSQDPEDMARKLAARERRNRLARKTGSAA